MFDYFPVTSPYPGLRPFEPYEGEIFFGREDHTDRLLEILHREHFLAVIGPSGCGKSSLVRAGLLPGLASGALGTGSDWRLAMLRPSGQPILALAQSLLASCALGPELVGRDRIPKNADDITADTALIAAELRRGADGLANLMQTTTARRLSAMPLNLLVLVDQFEEIFTCAATGEDLDDETKAFVDLLLAVRANKVPHLHVALTMRTDFLGDCVRYLYLPDAINHAQYLTPRLSPEEMEQAIIGPARVFGGNVESGLVDNLMQEIHPGCDQLPILQHCLARMWRVAERSNCDAPLINEACADAVGGVHGALQQHAEEVWRSLCIEYRDLAESLFRAITARSERGGQFMRRPQPLAAIANCCGKSSGDLKPTIETFAASEVSFLHYGHPLTDTSVIDLTHEALIRQWDKLGSWAANEYERGQGYRRWSQRATEYQQGIGSLLAGGDLVRALDWWNPSKNCWRLNAAWARRYSERQEDLADEVLQTKRFLIDSQKKELDQKIDALRCNYGEVVSISTEIFPGISVEKFPVERVESGCLSSLFALFKPVGVVAGFEDVAVVGDAVQ